MNDTTFISPPHSGQQRCLHASCVDDKRVEAAPSFIETRKPEPCHNNFCDSVASSEYTNDTLAECHAMVRNCELSTVVRMYHDPAHCQHIPGIAR